MTIQLHRLVLQFSFYLKAHSLGRQTSYVVQHTAILLQFAFFKTEPLLRHFLLRKISIPLFHDVGVADGVVCIRHATKFYSC